MNGNGRELEPKKVFDIFREICSIPHGSGNEAALSAHLERYARARGFWTARDGANNLIVRKPAAAGYENAPAVILQAHMDMVCEKNAETRCDFLTDPIKSVADGDYMRAEGTTLGADNGIGAAMALAALEDCTAHPALEVLLTTDEEVGMIGAETLDGGSLDGKLMINLDSEDEGVFFTSCAGGMRANLTLDAEYTASRDDCEAYALKVLGLKGGHSGMEIDKQRANANVLLGRVLNSLREAAAFSLAAIGGGLKENAIPREAGAVIVLNRAEVEAARGCVANLRGIFNKEFAGIEDEIKLLLEPAEKTERVFTEAVCGKVISTVLLIPDGVQYMSAHMPGLVESSNNLGVVLTEGGKVMFRCALRSSEASRKYLTADRLRALCDMTGAKLTLEHDYPAWEYRADSELRRKLCEAYRAFAGKEPELTAVHAGLECGILSDKLGGVDIISFGPNISGAHTPEEKVSISSVGRVYKFLLEALNTLK